MDEEELIKKHSGEWILFFNDEIVDHSNNLEKMLRLADKKFPSEKYPDDLIKISKVLSGDIRLL